MGGEGRITRDGSVGHFKRGGCLVAIRAGKPVVPVAMAGGSEMRPMGSLRLRPGRLTVCFGEPMSTAGLTDDDAPDLAARVRDEVVRMREQHRFARSTQGQPSAVTVRGHRPAEEPRG